MRKTSQILSAGVYFLAETPMVLISHRDTTLQLALKPVSFSTMITNLAKEKQKFGSISSPLAYALVKRLWVLPSFRDVVQCVKNAWIADERIDYVILDAAVKELCSGWFYYYFFWPLPECGQLLTFICCFSS